MTLCVLCPVFRPAARARPPAFGLACESCGDRIRAELGEIPDLYALVPAELVPTSGPGVKVSGTRTAPLPVRLDALNLLVANTADGPIHDDAQDQVGAIPPLGVLDSWVREWIDTRGRREHQPVPTVTRLSGWLLDRLDWALEEHPAIDEFARDINQALRSIRGVVHSHHSGEPVGRCPSKLNDDSRCNTRLYADPYLDMISCGRCGTSWTRSGQGWIRLRVQQLAWEDRNQHGEGEAA